MINQRVRVLGDTKLHPFWQGKEGVVTSIYKDGYSVKLDTGHEVYLYPHEVQILGSELSTVEEATN